MFGKGISNIDGAVWSWLFENKWWQLPRAVCQGHSGFTKLFVVWSTQLSLVSSSQDSQKSSVMPEGSHNQNDSSCQHSGETFNFVGPKLKARASGWLSGAGSSPVWGGGALKLRAQHLSSKPARQQGPCQRCTAEMEQGRSRAQPSLRAESGLSCAPWCCSPDYRLHPAQCHITTIPKDLNSAVVCCLMQRSFP